MGVVDHRHPVELAPKETSRQGVKIVTVNDIGLKLIQEGKRSEPEAQQATDLAGANPVGGWNGLDPDHIDGGVGGFGRGQLAGAVPGDDRDRMAALSKPPGFFEHARIWAKAVGKKHGAMHRRHCPGAGDNKPR